MKPTASSLLSVAEAVPDVAALELPVPPLEASRGFAVAMPLNSSTWRAMAGAPVVTVTVLTDLASAVYQSSPSELVPGDEVVAEPWSTCCRPSR